ncbi:hypothetical protein ACIGNX_27590 [Actinosynnema sp. NPDC053489]|uniref:hypothetical protein n=1 Tax=Actinosynnema sp. NPDC053489 TaxID=3363916 RepID=UPI0037C824F3
MAVLSQGIGPPFGYSLPLSARGRLGLPAMTTPAELERKVRQLDNDVQSIYEMLATIEATQKRQGNRLAEIANAQVEHGSKLDAILELLRGKRPE